MGKGACCASIGTRGQIPRIPVKDGCEGQAANHSPAAERWGQGQESLVKCNGQMVCRIHLKKQNKTKQENPPQTNEKHRITTKFVL